MVFVVVVNHSEALVTVTLIKADRDGIIRPHFQSQVGAVVSAHTRLRLIQELFAKAEAARELQQKFNAAYPLFLAGMLVAGGLMVVALKRLTRGSSSINGPH